VLRLEIGLGELQEGGYDELADISFYDLCCYWCVSHYCNFVQIFYSVANRW